MRLVFRKEFIKGLSAIRDPELADDIEHTLEELASCTELEVLTGIKKLQGHRDLYRIRVGDYRIGMKHSGNTVTVVCIYHRSEVYNHFP